MSNLVPERPARRRVTFTMVELMVVTLIIAVLVTTLLPAVMKARERARYGRWQGQIASRRSDEGLVALYDFEDGKGDRVTNKAVGVDVPDYAPESVDGWKPSFGLCRWQTGRWPGKGAMGFAGLPLAFVEMPTTRYMNPAEGAVGLWAIRQTEVSGPDPAYGASGHAFDLNSPGGGNAVSILADAEGGVAVNMGDRAGVPIGKSFDDRWHFVVVTWESGVFKVYWDGQVVLSDEYTPFEAFPPRAGIGSMYGIDTTGMPFNYAGVWTGRIDEVFVYNRALSAEEVTALYKMGL